MQILYKVNKDGSKNAWTCKAFMISKRVASVLPANILVVRGNTAILHGKPELESVTHEDGTEGFRLVGVSGKLMETLVTITAQAEVSKKPVGAVDADDEEL